jgi:hypothetical protein
MFNLLLLADTEFRKDPTKNLIRGNGARNFSERVSGATHIDRDKLPCHSALNGLKCLPQEFTSPAQRVAMSHIRHRDTLCYL